MYLTIRNRLREALVRYIQEHYSISMDVVLDRPPKIEMGEAASPVCFELAKRLKKAPRIIAQEIANGLGKVEGIARVEVAGAGYLNAYFDRAAFWSDLSPLATRHSPLLSQKKSGKVIVEHTSINPNKAAHIGHVRNAVLGDTMARVLRHAGHPVQVQNYIDNTGVQVADVVIGVLDMERRTPVSVKMFAMEPRFDYYCWDLYAKATHFFEEDKERAAALRGRTLKAIEEGRGEEAEVAQVVADAIVSLHLRTMARLGIFYELLARESEILHLKFWDAAFEKLKASAAIQLAASGKMAGCWIMPWKEEKSGINAENAAVAENTEKIEDEENTQDKIIVRSNGTVTYVGKDIAYHLWKFGLLGRDFAYQRFFAYADRDCWISAETGEANHPEFGGADSIYNVIDARQSDPQANVIEALRGLGYTEQAARYTHFSYEMVALTPRCALELGYEVSAEDRARPYIEVSGRKGFGVKADDLIDKLILATRAEVDSRHPELSEGARDQTAREIAVGALRYFMLRFTRNSVIAFDFKDALSFEGETGPYLQYAVVRTRSIFRKAGSTAEDALCSLAALDLDAYLSGEGSEGIWEVWLRASKTTLLLDQCISTAEPAYLAKHAFQLAQDFSNFYRLHHILSEENPARKQLLLATAAVTQRELVRSLAWLGITAPEVM